MAATTLENTCPQVWQRELSRASAVESYVAEFFNTCDDDFPAVWPEICVLTQLRRYSYVICTKSYATGSSVTSFTAMIRVNFVERALKGIVVEDVTFLRCIFCLL